MLPKFFIGPPIYSVGASNLIYYLWTIWSTIINKLFDTFKKLKLCWWNFWTQYLFFFAKKQFSWRKELARIFNRKKSVSLVLVCEVRENIMYLRMKSENNIFQSNSHWKSFLLRVTEFITLKVERTLWELSYQYQNKSNESGNTCRIQLKTRR